MNTRFIVTEKEWFGGGADITPTYKNSQDSKKISNFFHKISNLYVIIINLQHTKNTKDGVMSTSIYLIEKSQED